MFATGLHPGATISQVVLTDPAWTNERPALPVPSADPNGDATITFIVPSGLSANGSYSASISDSAGDSATSNDDFVFTSGPSSSASSPRPSTTCRWRRSPGGSGVTGGSSRRREPRRRRD